MAPLKHVHQDTSSDFLSTPVNNDLLQKQIFSPVPEIRRQAIQELDLTDVILTDLLKIAFSEEDPSVQHALFCRLAQKREEIIPYLIPLLKSDQPFIRNMVIQMMRQYPEITGGLVDSLLMDEDSDTRIFTLNILQELHHPRIEEWLTNVFKNESHINVCSAALEACMFHKIFIPDAWQTLLDRYPDDSFIEFTISRMKDTLSSDSKGENHV